MPSSQTTANAVTGATKSLADVMALLEQDSRLDPPRRRAYLGAARTMCSVLGRPAEALPGTMPELERLLRGVPVPIRGRSKKTISNTRSRLKAALLHVAGASELPPRGTPLTPEWAALFDAITDLRLRHGLSRLIRIAAFRGLTPNEVDDAFVQEMLASIAAVNSGRNLNPHWRKTVELWNEAAATVPGWPQTRLTPPPESTRPRHLSLAELPPSFSQDLDAYLAWARGADPLADDTPATSLKPSTLRQRREHLRLAASTLASCLGYPKRIHRLATLVDPMNMRAILNAYLQRAPNGEPTAFIRGLAVTLLAVARHWVKVSPEQLEVLKRLNRKLGSAPTGLTAKNQDLVRRFEDRELLLALLELPTKLQDQLRTRRLSPARRLQKMQIALAIEMLLAAPMRLQNLAMLELDRSLQWPSGRDGAVYVVLRRDETKNELPLEYPLEGRTRDLLHEYLDRYRSYTKAGDRPWLFVHMDGTRVPDSALRDGITKAVARELGIKMTPHMFRHLAAAIALDARPGALGLVRDLLGHRNIKTTSSFYAGMRTREAAREYDRILERSRKSMASED
jgi:integrase